MNFIEEVRFLFPWLPEALVQIYADAWADNGGDSGLAWVEMQQSDIYDFYFSGNRREDGSIRNLEAEYMATIEGYENAFRSVGLNPELFRSSFTLLIEGNVSADELMAERITPIYERVLDSSPEIRAYYAEVNGLELTDAALLAMALDPDVGTSILNRTISIAEVGGEAAVRNFDITSGYAESLVQQGVGRAQAQDLFGDAAEELPILDVLAQRHADPDDDFDIYEFTNAAIFDDPIQRKRIRRLIAQERQSFTQSVGMGALATRDQERRAVGLALQ